MIAAVAEHCAARIGPPSTSETIPVMMGDRKACMC